MDRKGIKALSREQIRGKVWMLFLCSLIAFLIFTAVTNTISSAVDFILSAVQLILRTPPHLVWFYSDAYLNLLAALRCLISISSFLLCTVLTYGMVLNYMAVTRGEEVSVERTFEGFKSFGKVFMLYLLMLLYFLLWSLLFIIPGIIKLISYSFAPYILAENPELSPSEAIERSKQMTSGHKWELFVLGLSFILWILLLCVTGGLAIIYVGPYMATAYVNAYNALKPNDDSVPELSEPSEA